MARPKDPSLNGKTEQINTRVEPETRNALQAAADAKGVSLSREIENRLVWQLNSERSRNGGREETDGLLAALRIVIGEVEALTGQEWQADGFTRDCVADAVSWLVRFIGPDSGPPPASFPAGFGRWASEQLRLENGRQLIDFGVGKHCAEETARGMASAAIFPKEHPLSSVAAENWGYERIAARGLKGLVRVRIRGKDEAGNGD